MKRKKELLNYFIIIYLLVELTETDHMFFYRELVNIRKKERINEMEIISQTWVNGEKKEILVHY